METTLFDEKSLGLSLQALYLRVSLLQICGRCLEFLSCGLEFLSSGNVARTLRGRCRRGILGCGRRSRRGACLPSLEVSRRQRLGGRERNARTGTFSHAASRGAGFGLSFGGGGLFAERRDASVARKNGASLRGFFKRRTAEEDKRLLPVSAFSCCFGSCCCCRGFGEFFASKLQLRRWPRSCNNPTTTRATTTAAGGRGCVVAGMHGGFWQRKGRRVFERSVFSALFAKLDFHRDLGELRGDSQSPPAEGVRPQGGAA